MHPSKMIKTDLPNLEDPEKNEPTYVGMCSFKDRFLLVTGGWHYLPQDAGQNMASTLTFLLDVEKG